MDQDKNNSKNKMLLPYFPPVMSEEQRKAQEKMRAIVERENKLKAERAALERTLINLKKDMQSCIKGQDKALQEIQHRLIQSFIIPRQEQKPGAVMFLAGPPGVGKTEAAETLAQLLRYHFLRINMNEYAERGSANNLFGAPPSYIGYDTGGRLDEIRNNPKSVILLDEMEKAHPQVHETLYQVLEKGIATDNHHRTLNFKDAIIVMTSNVGMQSVRTMGPLSNIDDKTMEFCEEKFNRRFDAAFRSRLGSLIHFEHLSPESLMQIAELQTQKFNEELVNSHRCSIKLSRQAKEYLCRHGYNEEHGARELKGVFDATVRLQVSMGLLSGRIPQYSEIDVKEIRPDKTLHYQTTVYGLHRAQSVKTRRRPGRRNGRAGAVAAVQAATLQKE